MSIEIKVPVLPESVVEGTIATWHKKPGEQALKDEQLLDVETDKIVLEVVAPEDGYLETILKKEGETVKTQEVVGLFHVRIEKPAEPVAAAPADKKILDAEKAVHTSVSERTTQPDKPDDKNDQKILTPAVRRLVSEQGLNVSQLEGTGKSNRISKEDVLKSTHKAKETITNPAVFAAPSVTSTVGGERIEKRVAMNRLTARMAERMLQAQHNAAILTTFSEINMQPVIDLRTKYQDTFEKDYSVRLGFMSFFTIAVVEALKRFPIINASVDGSDIVYHAYFDIGIAVNSTRGLVVPILRNAENLDMAQIEKQLLDFRNRAKEGRLNMEEITGGTFTITNGGVLGSLLSTPIINPPQSAILGMHKIQERPVVENGEIVIRPMMYVALSYDHCIIDGADSIQFLVTVKELLEDPARLLLNV
jgi:2-oxoglutarate dehydrogenase E2 component (dihydrolipoamide succinyltransferase)